jgi:hypothetical protein
MTEEYSEIIDLLSEDSYEASEVASDVAEENDLIFPIRSRLYFIDYLCLRCGNGYGSGSGYGYGSGSGYGYGSGSGYGYEYGYGSGSGYGYGYGSGYGTRLISHILIIKS